MTVQPTCAIEVTIHFQKPSCIRTGRPQRPCWKNLWEKPEASLAGYLNEAAIAPISLILSEVCMNGRFSRCAAPKYLTLAKHFVRCERMQQGNRIHTMGSMLPLGRLQHIHNLGVHAASGTEQYYRSLGTKVAAVRPANPAIRRALANFQKQYADDHFAKRKADQGPPSSIVDF